MKRLVDGVVYDQVFFPFSAFPVYLPAPFRAWVGVPFRIVVFMFPENIQSKTNRKSCTLLILSLVARKIVLMLLVGLGGYCDKGLMGSARLMALRPFQLATNKCS